MVTLVDVERRNAMTALMVDEIVATFDTLEADGTTAAVVVTGEPPAFCSGADVSSLGALARAETDDRTPVGHVDLRGLPPRAALAAAHDRGGERRGRRRGDEPRARVRRAPRGNVGPLRHPVRQDRAASRRRPRVDARTRGRTAGGRGDGPVRRRGRRRRAPPRSGSRGRAIPTTNCSTRPARSRRAPPAPRTGLLDIVKATLRQAPWQPDFEAAVTTEVARQAWSLGQGWFPPTKEQVTLSG